MPSAPRPPIAVLRRAFVDICRGYSVASMPGTGQPVYIRHLSHGHHIDFDDQEERFKAAARAQGASTEAERVTELKEAGLWTPAHETAIAMQREMIARMEVSRNTIAVPSVLRSHDEQLDGERKTLGRLLMERAQLIGTTVESDAARRLEDFYLVHNLFADKEMEAPLLTWDTFEDLDDNEVDAIHEVYRVAIEHCTDVNLKHLAVQDFFLGYFGLSSTDLSSFFGRPICDFSYYQARLANVARYYRSLMEGTDMTRLTPENRNDPDAIERLVIVGKNQAVMTSEGKLPSGLTSQDIKEMGLEGKYTKLPEKELNNGFEVVKHFMKNNQARAAAAGRP